MPIPQPEDTEGLWSAVQDKVEWPAGNEDLVRDLAGDWGFAAQLFDSAHVLDLAELDAAWPDSVGDTFGQSVKVMKDRSSRLEISARQQQADLLEYAEVVAAAKNGIRSIIEQDARGYGAALRDGFGMAPRYAQIVIDKIHALTAEAAGAADRIKTGAAVQGPAGDGYTEYEDINRFIYDELTTNVQSPEARRIRELLATGDPVKALEATQIWFDKVKTNADWDHKPDILAMTVGANTLTPIAGPDGQTGSIRHDFWSNLHYGYVGRDVGYTEEILTGAANAADLWEHWAVDPTDDASVRLGSELREQYRPDELTPEVLDGYLKDHWDQLVDAGIVVPDPE